MEYFYLLWVPKFYKFLPSFLSSHHIMDPIKSWICANFDQVIKINTVSICGKYNNDAKIKVMIVESYQLLDHSTSDITD